MRLRTLSMGWLILMACQGKPESLDDPAMRLQGKELAQVYCQGCHQWTSPTALDKVTWQNSVLPEMAHYLGIHSTPYSELFEQDEAGKRVRQAEIFPTEAVLDEQEWQAITTYFTQEAPESLDVSVDQIAKLPSELFEVLIPPFRLNQPLVSMIAKNYNRLVVGDVKRDMSQLTFLSRELEEEYQIQVHEAPVQFFPTKDGFYVLCMGRMYPSDAAQGSLIKVQETIDPDGSRHFKAARVLERLQRPVSMAIADLDGDGDDDFVVCEFGYRIGRLGWYELTNHGYQYHLLQRDPGAIQVEVQDFTNDGRMDLIVLFAQGDERMMLYTNLGQGLFGSKQLLQFLPVVGSTSFELTDWNQDGHSDILYTCGDNADYSQIVKPYHGIKLFLNDGSNNYQENFFLEHHGAYQAHATDYDHDGDLDIAAISFFPDYANQPKEGFIYYQNEGNNEFTRYSMPEATQGRWVRMLSYDYEGDGDEDILLGSFVGLPPRGDTTQLYEQWMNRKMPIILLKNQAKLAS